MKNIQYFLDEEDKYCQTKPEEVEVWDEDAQDWDHKRIPLDFLRSRPFHQNFNNIDYRRERTKGYYLSDAELTVLGMFSCIVLPHLETIIMEKRFLKLQKTCLRY